MLAGVAKHISTRCEIFFSKELGIYQALDLVSPSELSKVRYK